MTSPTIPQSPEIPQEPAIPPTTAGEAVLWEAATQGLELADLAARVFETGIEPPDADPDVAFLRDVLRSARLDLDLLGAAMEHVNPETVVRAAVRAETQITFALALHTFLQRYRVPIGGLAAGELEDTYDEAHDTERPDVDTEPGGAHNPDHDG